MLRLSVITVYKMGNLSELLKTYHSVYCQTFKPYEYIIVVSGVKETKNFKSNFKQDFVRFIINSDKSLYNAMNIGCNASCGNAVVFLNGGDTFYGSNSINLISTQYKPGKCLLFRTLQKYQELNFIRPKISNISLLKTSPSHQSFIAPLPQAKIFNFNEKNIICADTLWMNQLVSKYGVIISSSILSTFELGGISNYPTLHSIRKRFLCAGFLRSCKEFLKFLLIKMLKPKLYYKLVLSRNCELYINE